MQVSLLCVTRLVAPHFNPDRTGWGSGFSSERWRVTWSWKIPRTPKDGCLGNREEDGYWTSHHFYCQLTYTGSLSLQQAGLRDWVPLCVMCLHQNKNSALFLQWITAALRLLFAEASEIWRWICLALGLGSQTAIIITDLLTSELIWTNGEGFFYIWGKPCRGVPNGQNTRLFVQSSLWPTLSSAIPHSAFMSSFSSRFSSSNCMALSFLCPCLPCATAPPPMPSLYLLRELLPHPQCVPAAMQSLKLM